MLEIRSDLIEIYYIVLFPKSAVSIKLRLKNRLRKDQQKGDLPGDGLVNYQLFFNVPVQSINT
ncbi:hypothetical protein [Evansella tamaricis]|uniref:Uncharacterized protein n=1 Tax=Evansella tamaricis TaxID=2069301 RepID=A0ABS6JFI1_9BACI|nr:hypothetical protein [Evansella tamaricis]MBU9712441.1 hypothetical protein [Evansella tamaricis]